MNETRRHRVTTRLVLLLLLGISGVLCVLPLIRSNAQTKSSTADSDYNAQISQNYDLKFGPNPFAPSNATSTTGTFIPGEMFVSAKRCGTCHTDAHAQWRQSAHGNAFREPFYQKNVKDIQSQKGIEFTRHCESCHNPAALFTGALTKNSHVKRPFDDDGVSCIACHSIQAANSRGIGGYVMGEPALLVKEDGTRLLTGVTDQQILNDVPSHRRAMMRPLLKTPEFCGACHKSQVPRELNDYKFLRAFMVADELQQSSFSKESPHPFYVRDKETCNTCHMKREAAPLFDVSAKNGTLTSHRWATANTAIPTYYKWKDQLEAVSRFLEDDKLGVDIFAIRRKAAAGGAEELIAPLNHSNYTIGKGDRLTAEVVITNKNIGHSFPPELRDFYEAYVEFVVSDDGGKILYQSGFIKPDGYLDESAHNYKTYLVKSDGNFNDKHHIWRTRTFAQNNQIQSGRSDVARYQFKVAENLTGAMHLTARVRYRRFTRVFSDYSLGKSVDYPIVTMATAEYLMQIGQNQAATPDPSNKTAVPDWRRWNNYGIAALDNRQYPVAIEAFTHAAELDEKYRPMALVNRAIAYIELEQYDEAASILDGVLKANPTLARALFQQARIFVKRGQLDQAETNIRQILAMFPRDRMSLQQLGELCKIKRDYEGALDCFQKILAIDPEDAGAHYNLMLIYRKVGRTDDAKREAKIFADLKDDPGALALANQFLHKHPEMSNESVYWHVHDLSRTY
ncbi:MAG TPA: tetratricopeptide repeat protein [Pyrinomonadaceae bacterium]|nr:tetratricopeptide repeat protein [Pyrinomonadaceae bacterium]